MKSMYEPIEWLDRARLEIYEETKDMTPEERVEYFHTSAIRIAKEYGLTRTYEQLLKIEQDAQSAARM